MALPHSLPDRGETFSPEDYFILGTKVDNKIFLSQYPHIAYPLLELLYLLCPWSQHNLQINIDNINDGQL